MVPIKGEIRTRANEERKSVQHVRKAVSGMTEIDR
jgi:hypothetical protein